MVLAFRRNDRLSHEGHRDRESATTTTMLLVSHMLEFFGKGPGNPFLHKKGFPGASSKDAPSERNHHVRRNYCRMHK